MFIAINSKAQQTGTFTDKRDGKSYKTVEIGTQTWMAENLAYKTDSGCWAYNKQDSNMIKYGYLYNLETAKTACPVGWHLPSKEEFNSLLQNFGGAGKNAFEALVPSGNSGFAALLGGLRYNNGRFSNLDFSAIFWSSSQSSKTSAWYLYMNSENPTLMSSKDANVACGLGETLGFSVRCVRD